ncbi:hypothetical protein [Aliikangiella maris]|uniref:Uncharacterized protein n=2 Tax=Aliikangiella maris TaxID=3162458 RepID=A0ABV3MVJ5_9GAMM
MQPNNRKNYLLFHYQEEIEKLEIENALLKQQLSDMQSQYTRVIKKLKRSQFSL